MSDGSRSALSRRRWRWTTSEPCPPFRGGFAPLPRRSASIALCCFPLPPRRRRDRAYLLGRGRLVRRRRGRRCPDLRAALPGDPAHAAGQRAVFWTKTRVQQGERYRIVRTPRGAACTACRSRCSAWPVWRAPSAWGRAYRRFTAGAAGAVAGGLGGLSGGAAAVRTGGRRGRAGCRHASVRC